MELLLAFSTIMFINFLSQSISSFSYSQAVVDGWNGSKTLHISNWNRMNDCSVDAVLGYNLWPLFYWKNFKIVHSNSKISLGSTIVTNAYSKSVTSIKHFLQPEKKHDKNTLNNFTLWRHQFFYAYPTKYLKHEDTETSVILVRSDMRHFAVTTFLITVISCTGYVDSKYPSWLKWVVGGR